MGRGVWQWGVQSTEHRGYLYLYLGFMQMRVFVSMCVCVCIQVTSPKLAHHNSKLITNANSPSLSPTLKKLVECRSDRLQLQDAVRVSPPPPRKIHFDRDTFTATSTDAKLAESESEVVKEIGNARFDKNPSTPVSVRVVEDVHQNYNDDKKTLLVLTPKTPSLAARKQKYPKTSNAKPAFKGINRLHFTRINMQDGLKLQTDKGASLPGA